MAHLHQVFNVHWGSESKDDPGTLHEIKTILQRKRINENTSEVYECEQLLEIAVESSILGIALAAQHVKSIEALCSKLVNWDILESLVLSITDKIDDQQIHLSRYRPKEERDMVFENNWSLVNDGISHLEYLRAIRAGDIGAILKVLDLWTVEFHASSKTGQYAQELLSIASKLKHQWSKLQNMLTDHWIINLSGRPGKWQEPDLVQESHNRIEKAIYSGKT